MRCRLLKLNYNYIYDLLSTKAAISSQSCPQICTQNSQPSAVSLSARSTPTWRSSPAAPSQITVSLLPLPKRTHPHKTVSSTESPYLHQVVFLFSVHSQVLHISHNTVYFELNIVKIEPFSSKMKAIIGIVDNF